MERETLSLNESFADLVSDIKDMLPEDGTAVSVNVAEEIGDMNNEESPAGERQIRALRILKGSVIATGTRRDFIKHKSWRFRDTLSSFDTETLRAVADDLKEQICNFGTVVAA